MTLRCRCEAHSRRASLTKVGFCSWTENMIDHDSFCRFHFFGVDYEICAATPSKSEMNNTMQFT